MAGAYDDRDGWIWMDGKLVEWRQANVHILTHAMHYASSVFEGERAYNGKIFESRRHSERLLASGRLLDVDIPWTVDEIEAAKYEVMKANGLTDAYVRAVAWRGSGEDMGVSSAKNPVRLAVAAWEWGSYYGDAKMKGAKLDISKWKRPSPETIPVHAKAAGLYMICTMSKHAAEAKGCSDALFMDYRGYVAEATGANIFFVKDGEVHTPDGGRVPERHHAADRHRHAGRAAGEGAPAPHHARELESFRAVLADRHGGGGHPGGTDRRLQLRGRRDDPRRGDGV
jgi:branched-chain amino acid aminotransferase